MIPIAKNITVKDESGNVLEPTYPKRAKGLVKNNRARFTDERTIELTENKACSPNNREDTKVEINQVVNAMFKLHDVAWKMMDGHNGTGRLLPGAPMMIHSYNEMLKESIESNWIPEGVFEKIEENSVDGLYKLCCMADVVEHYLRGTSAEKSKASSSDVKSAAYKDVLEQLATTNEVAMAALAMLDDDDSAPDERAEKIAEIVYSTEETKKHIASLFVTQQQ